jgi:Zn-dependent protease with chaperone function
VDFWNRQLQAKRYSLLLGILFLIAVMLTIFVMNALVGLVLFIFQTDQSIIWHHYSGCIVSLMLFIIVGGSLLEMFRLREGGRALAKRLGARRINLNATVPEERLLKNVVEEISIASGIQPPVLYVLDNEFGINAFVAGYRPFDMVLIVTWGMLQKLDRQEIQGVVAHEYSHILHGDPQLNLRLMALVSGLLSVSQIGSWIAQVGISFSSRASAKDRRSDALFLLMGSAIWLIGSLGVLTTRVLKFAIIRQREYLADAASIQFTRSTGLLQALLRIRAHDMGSQLHGVYAETISHFCFGDALYRNGWFSTHPPLDDRIYSISPAALRRAVLQERILSRDQPTAHHHELEAENIDLQNTENVPLEWEPPQPLPLMRLHPVALPVKDEVKPLNADVRQHAVRPDMIKRAMSTSAGCRELLAVIMALRQSIACEPEKQQISRALVEAMAELDPRLYVDIFLQALHHMGEIPISAARQVLTRLADIIQSDGHIGLLDILLLERVKAHFHLLPDSVPVSLEDSTLAIVLLVESLLHVQQVTETQASKARVRVLRTILSPAQLLDVDLYAVKNKPINLGQVLQQLSGLLKREKMNVLAVAETCLWVDTRMTQEEQDVLDLLYWRFGFESQMLMDHTNKKMALEI